MNRMNSLKRIPNTFFFLIEFLYIVPIETCTQQMNKYYRTSHKRFTWYTFRNLGATYRALRDVCMFVCACNFTNI